MICKSKHRIKKNCLVYLIDTIQFVLLWHVLREAQASRERNGLAHSHLGKKVVGLQHIRALFSKINRVTLASIDQQCARQLVGWVGI